MRTCICYLLFLFAFPISVYCQVEDTVRVQIENGILEGSLLVPDLDRITPVALIIAGSGPTDRDGNNVAMKNNSLKMLAEGLYKKGIASLRYDKRGIGKSSLENTEEKDVRFEDFVNDAREWLKFLDNDQRFGEITVIGHSEGSLIGMLISQDPVVDKYVSVAGAGRPAGDVIREQLAAQPPMVLEMSLPIIEDLEKGNTVDSVPLMLFSLFRPSVQPYVISWFKYDPAREIAKLNKPALIIQGTTDIQVAVSEAKILSESNPAARLEILEGMNHILKEAEKDRMKNISTYSKPDLPLKEGLVDKIASFIAPPSTDTIFKPFARYWWFASRIKKEDVMFNLDWLKECGFGGVELAWVYPLNAKDERLDTSYTPRQEWLSPEWQEIVGFTIEYADKIGLECDMTMGTLWPFGDSHVSYDEATQIFGEESPQVISRSWEYPKTGYVVDHLNPESYLKYFNRMLDSFPHPMTSRSRSYFVDSWEVETEKLWTDDFDEDFQDLFDYDITQYMDSIYSSNYSGQLYDYMKLISEKAIGFYEDFDSVLNSRGYFSRGQCSGAPCDIISAYSRLDIPEGEAMLYEPEFNSIPASAALLSDKKTVSAETFTCLYGWPADYIREEQTADLKLVSDALFANGVNHIIWHGKAHNPKGQDTINFYASVHLGKDGALAKETSKYNSYLEKVGRYMKKGRTYSDIAVYIPTEDAWTRGIMPAEKQFIWAWGYYEMRYVYFPKELRPYHPVWINREFLEKGKVHDGTLFVGGASFNSLYVDVEYLDPASLDRIEELAGQGLAVYLINEPSEAGAVKHKEWETNMKSLLSLPNVKRSFDPVSDPLVKGDNLPPYWAREEQNELYIYFANPKSRGLKFPVDYGQSFCETSTILPVQINYADNSFELELVFEPYQSLLYHIKGDTIEQIDIEFIPETPVIRERPEGYTAPWLVK